MSFKGKMVFPRMEISAEMRVLQKLIGKIFEELSGHLLVRGPEMEPDLWGIYSPFPKWGSEALCGFAIMNFDKFCGGGVCGACM